jgi:hypothetical protein
MTIAKMLNLGSGRTKLPGPRPDHHALVPEGIYAYPYWLNISKNASEEPDCVMDLFAYPWALESNAYEGALLSHLVEHIPHEIKLQPFKTERSLELEHMQDGWYAFFSELYRVLKPGALVHILSPYGWSDGAITDPTHTRYVTDRTFMHSMQPDPNSPFEYATGGINFRFNAHSFGLTPYFAHLAPLPSDSPSTLGNKNTLLTEALATHINVVSDIYVQLECVK